VYILVHLRIEGHPRVNDPDDAASNQGCAPMCRVHRIYEKASVCTTTRQQEITKTVYVIHFLFIATGLNEGIHCQHIHDSPGILCLVGKDGLDKQLRLWEKTLRSLD